MGNEQSRRVSLAGNSEKKEFLAGHEDSRNPVGAKRKNFVSQEKYRMWEVIGSGSFGEVRRCEQKGQPDIALAVKVMVKDAGEGPWSILSMFQREVEFLSKIKHDNIIQLYDAWEEANLVFMVTELCAGGELFDLLLRKKFFTESDASTLAAQMLDAIGYLHEHQIMHRDIKAENFLLSGEDSCVVKLIDFGMASPFQEGQKFHEVCGSPYYLAPELIGKDYDCMVDIWAFGILMYLLTLGRYPFKGANKKELQKRIADPIDWKPKLTDPLSPTTLDFLRILLERNPRDRATSKEAKEHAFIRPNLEDDLSRSSLMSQDSNLHASIEQAQQEIRATRHLQSSTKLLEVAKQKKISEGRHEKKRLSKTERVVAAISSSTDMVNRVRKSVVESQKASKVSPVDLPDKEAKEFAKIVPDVMPMCEDIGSPVYAESPTCGPHLKAPRQNTAAINGPMLRSGPTQPQAMPRSGPMLKSKEDVGNFNTLETNDGAMLVQAKNKTKESASSSRMQHPRPRMLPPLESGAKLTSKARHLKPEQVWCQPDANKNV
mmetsp:Transcript_45737/g.82329  ORF Transcript_45737/g.82329 Transcript_45737/m.82329 type:complete len:546 (+) Transcript_45737:44-1681(+)